MPDSFKVLCKEVEIWCEEKQHSELAISFALCVIFLNLHMKYVKLKCNNNMINQLDYVFICVCVIYTQWRAKNIAVQFNKT